MGSIRQRGKVHEFFGFGRTLGFGLLLALTGCADAASEAEVGVDTSGALEGELSVVSIFDSPAGQPSSDYSLRPAEGSASLHLIFETDPNLPSNTPIRVWGNRDGSSLHVSRFERVVREASGLGSNRSAILDGPQKTRTVAWVQMNVMNGGVNQTVAAANALIFDQNPGPRFGSNPGDKSVAQYYDENSFGMLTLSGRVEGPIPFNDTACNNFDPLGNAMRDAIADMGRTYDHYYLWWGSQQDCGPGWGAQGTAANPQDYVWLNNDGTFCAALGQELGHNFGLMHASTMRCGTSIIANNTASGCTSEEYGNRITVMGGGCRHLLAIEKWYSGWLLECNAVKVRSSATFTLLPIELPSDGLQALQIPMPVTNPARTTTTSQSNGPVTMGYYYLELRGGHGIDTGIKQGVYVYAAPDIPAANRNGPRTFQLDMVPGGNTMDPMTAGQRFDDPAGGVSFTLNSFNADSASVTVEIQGGNGANTCVDGTTFVGSGGAGTGGTGGAGTGGTGTGGSAAGGMGGSGLGTGGTGPSTGGTGPSTGGSGPGTGGTDSGAGGTDPGTGGTGVSSGGASVGGGPGTGGFSDGSGGLPGTGGAIAPGTGGAIQGSGGAAGSINVVAAGGTNVTGSGGSANLDPKIPYEVVGNCSCKLNRSEPGGLRSAQSLALLFAGASVMIGRRRRSRKS